MTEIRFIDLFAGIGGFRHGLERANDSVKTRIQQGIRQRGESNTTTKQSFMGTEQFHCGWSCEIDKWCERVYRRNFGHGFDAHDVKAVDASSIPDFDLLASGFPCQSFSIAGKRRGFQDTRGTLFFDICRILRAKRPRLLLLENVKGLLLDDGGQTFHTILESLDELGYDLQWEVLNSKNFGVPQNRERVFIVGHLGGTPRPQVFPLGEDGAESTETRRSEGQGIANTFKGRATGGGGYGDIDMPLILHNVYGGFRETEPRVFEDYSPTIRTPKGGGHLPLVVDIYNRQLRADQDVAGTLKGEGIADTSIGTALFDGMKLRRLTPLECERLQGFPDGWTEGVSDTQRYKMLGNAVTVNVVEAIGERLLG